jgi:outer membrane immunogenic protein
MLTFREVRVLHPRGGGWRETGTVMRKLLFAGVTLAALGMVGAAEAADLPAEPVYKGGPLIVPVYDWTGFYLGISGGYSRGNAANTYAITGFAPVAGSTRMDGGVFGGQAGFNWQANRNFVVGLEVDLQGTWQNGTDNPPAVSTTTCAAAIPICTVTTNVVGVDQKLRWFGTARGRVGFLPFDHVMLYVTGGAAFGEIESNPTVMNTAVFTNNGVPFASFTQVASGTAINTHAGWTVGGGSEWVLSGPWTAKLEYLFVDLGTVTNTLVGGGAVPTVVASSHVRDNIVRIGLNYRFGGPVSASY